MNLPHKLYKSMGLTPLKFTFNLATPFVKSGYPIHLDSLVGFIFQRHHLPLEDAPNEAAIMAFLADLPFEKYEQDEDWVFKASALMPDAPMVHGSRFFYASLIRNGNGAGCGSGGHRLWQA